MATPQRQTDTEIDYRLDEQIGFLMRQANQRHLSIFGRHIDEYTPTQFATLAKIFEIGTVSQNDLGRQTAMDAATMKGVIDRLSKKGLVSTRPDPTDMRRLLVELTAAGEAAFHSNVLSAHAITEETLAPLNSRERMQLAALLGKMIKSR
ncbi:MAG: MarR family transcriptional regulator [Alphaproteobacteria bacterium]|nr:MarR family transcriptional regulator [Alphaproteobacteria bacterium]